MAQNDMYVVMYKIVAYLYDCMKRGAEPDPAQWDCAAMGIPEPYWASIVEQLVSHGYLSGVQVWHSDGRTKVAPARPQVTMEGVAFAQENSMMGKARKSLMDAKAAVPFLSSLV